MEDCRAAPANAKALKLRFSRLPTEDPTPYTSVVATCVFRERSVPTMGAAIFATCGARCPCTNKRLLSCVFAVITFAQNFLGPKPYTISAQHFNLGQAPRNSQKMAKTRAQTLCQKNGQHLPLGQAPRNSQTNAKARAPAPCQKNGQDFLLGQTPRNSQKDA